MSRWCLGTKKSLLRKSDVPRWHLGIRSWTIKFLRQADNFSESELFNLWKLGKGKLNFHNLLIWNVESLFFFIKREDFPYHRLQFQTFDSSVHAMCLIVHPCSLLLLVSCHMDCCCPRLPCHLYNKVYKLFF